MIEPRVDRLGMSRAPKHISIAFTPHIFCTKSVHREKEHENTNHILIEFQYLISYII